MQPKHYRSSSPRSWETANIIKHFTLIISLRCALSLENELVSVRPVSDRFSPCFRLNLRGGVKLMETPSSCVRSSKSGPSSKENSFKANGLKSRKTRPTKHANVKPKKKVLRGKEGWKASTAAYQDRQRARAAGAHITTEKGRDLGSGRGGGGGGDGSGGSLWASARRRLQQEKELGADMRDMAPALEQSVSEEGRAVLEARGVPSSLHRLVRAYPDLDNSSESVGGGGMGGGGGAEPELPHSGRRGGRNQRGFEADESGLDGESGGGSSGLDGGWENCVQDSASKGDLSSFAGF
jgi:hypothetical protein